METPIEIKVFVQKQKTQTLWWKELYNVFWVDNEWNKYVIDSHLYCAGDAWWTVAYRKDTE